jgi:DNA-3-methyladenine glycosylase
MIKHGQMRPHPSTDIQSYSVSRTIPKMVDSRFFDHFAGRVAHDLIGCRVCWRHGNETHSRIVTETEAYTGPDDLASHAARGRTERNAPMFDPPGTFYVYFVTQDQRQFERESSK